MMKVFNYVFVIVALISSTLHAETVTYYHTDALGTPVAATDESGNVLWREHYSPFGEKLDNSQASQSNNIGYTGHQFDSDTGLVYMQARYYDPVIGRFYSNDPVGYTASNPVMSFNRYLYVNNNPYKYTDPDGEFLNFAVKFVADVALGAALNYAETGSLNLSGAVTDAAVGVLNPAKTLQKAKRLQKVLSGRCSFTPETAILTKDGYKSIIEVKVGDVVLSKNDKTGKLSWREVTHTFKDWHEETITFTVVDENGIEESITTTAEHPFFVDNIGWLEAGSVTEGTVISGPKAENDISIVKIRVNQDPQYAYNFTVDTDHTYFVGKTNMWVHNSCPFAKGVNAKSVKQFGHSFKTHGAGAKNTQKLKDRAAGTGNSQGQFTNNDAAADFLSQHNGITSPTTVDLPAGLGQVIKPSGEIVSATKVTIVPKKGGGFKTAYPVE